LAVAWPTQPIEKPHGGFFTSSWDEQRKTSAWIEYHATTPRASESRSTYLLLPHTDALLYVIDSPKDYDRLTEAYPQRYAHNPNHPTVCPAWKDLAAEGPFDAIHMTAAATDHDLPYAHRWADESTLWFRPFLTLLDPP
jgi:hypothetical protein